MSVGKGGLDSQFYLSLAKWSHLKLQGTIMSWSILYLSHVIPSEAVNLTDAIIL